MYMLSVKSFFSHLRCIVFVSTILLSLLLLASPILVLFSCFYFFYYYYCRCRCSFVLFLYYLTNGKINKKKTRTHTHTQSDREININQHVKRICTVYYIVCTQKLRDKQREIIFHSMRINQKI